MRNNLCSVVVQRFIVQFILQSLTTHFISSPNSEMEHWRKQYEELFAKVRPFQVSHFPTHLQTRASFIKAAPINTFIL